MTNTQIIIWVTIRLLLGFLIGTTIFTYYRAKQYKNQLNYCRGLIQYQEDIKYPIGNIQLI